MAFSPKDMKPPERNDLSMLPGALLPETCKNLLILQFFGLGICLTPLFCKAFRISAEDDVSTAPRHICGDGNHTLATGLGDNFSFPLMLLGIQNVVGHTLFLQHIRKCFRLLNGDGPDQ